MATLALQQITRAGPVITPVAAAGGGDAMPPGAANWLRITNGGGSPITVTLAVNPSAAGWPSGPNFGNQAYVVTNGTTREIGPLVAQLFADPTTGLCIITYTAVTSVTVAAIQLVQP